MRQGPDRRISPFRTEDRSVLPGFPVDDLAVVSPDPEIGPFHGNLAALPAHEAVDLLVVSAFPDDYLPIPGTLIGALHDVGVSVAALARDKDVDLRDAYGCWLSRDLGTRGTHGFSRILCFEPARRGRPPEVVGDLFRALTPHVLGAPHIASIAMPIIASGDAAEDAGTMLNAILDAAIGWLGAGLPVAEIKIVELDRGKAERMVEVLNARRIVRVQPASVPHQAYDFFLSYSRADEDAAGSFAKELAKRAPSARVFVDREAISPGHSWQQAIWDELAACKRVVALLSDDYLRSKVCQEEYAIAMLRHRESQLPVLLPLYVRTAALPPHVRILNYVDCREADPAKLTAAAGQALGRSPLPA